jgi:hypothetical protein
MRRLPVVFLALLAAPGPAPAQLRSGPAHGGPAPATLPAIVVHGEPAAGQADLAEARDGEPTVFLFVRADRLDRPMARLMRTLDRALADGVEGAPEAAAVAVWITDDPGASREYLPRFQQSLELEKTALSVFEGSLLGPEGWDINDAASLTAVVVKGGKVVLSTGYDSLGEADVRGVVRAIKGDG